LGEVLGSFDGILVPELNRGQLARILRAEYLVPAVSYPKVQGLPFKAAEILAKIREVLSNEVTS
jgi:2-oxoglutarate ferredoxin oxidoreductase subunit alpha